jgi:rod shape-determining protein MreD
MRWFSFIIILMLATLLEAGNLLNLFAIGNWNWYIRPSILITLLVYYSIVCRTQDAIICAFMIGLAADITSRLIGPHIIVFGVLGLLLNACNQILLVQRAHFKAIIIFSVYFLAETMAHWLGLFKGQQYQSGYYTIILFTGLYSAIVGPVIWSILSSVSGRLKIKKARSERAYS